MTAYKFNFAWQSPYGHIVRMIEDLALSPGLIIDVGCGTAPIAEPLIERGFGYLGLEIDEEALALVRERGVDAKWLDLTKHETLARAIVEQVAGRPVAAMLMIDVIEHIPVPDAFLCALRTAAAELDRPPLFISVPNATHIDIVAKLNAARWDLTPTGLLDHTHVGFFGNTRITEVLGEHGWHEIARNDFRLEPSDQHFPADLATLGSRTNLGVFLRDVRDAADDFAVINQFVRAYVLLETTPKPPPASDPDRFLSVIVRTTGARSVALNDALTCLAGQTDTDFEVLLAVHTHDPDRVAEVHALAQSFDPTFAWRVQILHVIGGGRSRPLNTALERAKGRYVAFLDDDDLVTGDWVEQFKAGAADQPGRVVRSACADQLHAPGRSELVPFEPTGPITVSRPLRFDPIAHFHHNESPICSFALPMQTLRSLRLRFDETLSVVEDWDLLLRTTAWTGVVDTEVVTSIYRRWEAEEGSAAAHNALAWDAARDAVLDRLDAKPVLLPAGSVRRLAEAYPLLVAATRLSPPATAPTQVQIGTHHQSIEAELDAARARLAAIENSEWWKITAPMRRAGTVVRRLTGRA